MNDAQQNDRHADLLKKVVELSTGSDSFSAIDHVESQGEPLEVAQLYAQLVQNLYYKEKNVPLMLRVGRAGIHHCLVHARSDQEGKEKLLGVAKMMSFNLSVNCWPAWEDEGIVLSPSDIASGHDLARLNLRLAKELNRPADKVASAYWLLGAHQMAAQDTAKAIESFEEAAKLFAEAKQDDGHWMAKGYAGIAKCAEESSAAMGEKELQRAVSELRKIDTDDSKFYADQLESVDRFFTK